MADQAVPRLETGTIVVDGIETFFRRLPGEGPPAVFVHGNPTHSEDWMPFLERMRGPAIAFDLPGFGRSGRPSHDRFDHTMHSYSKFLDSFLDELGVNEHSLVVHDFGGLALIGAQAHPDRIHRLVLFNCLALLPGYRWHRLARAWRTPRLGEFINRLWSRTLLDQSLRESRGDWSRQDPEFVDMIWDHLDKGTLRAILALYRSAPEEELARAGESLGSLTAPALVVWGLKDRYLPARFGRAYAEALPDAELIELPDAGHWVWRDEPAVISKVTGFLEPT